MKGYNLPDNVSPSDPEAPWNEKEQDTQESDPNTCCEGFTYPSGGCEGRCPHYGNCMETLSEELS